MGTARGELTRRTLSVDDDRPGCLPARPSVTGRDRARARDPTSVAHGLLLPHARLGLGGGGRRPGDACAGMEGKRPPRGPLLRALLAVPHRNERGTEEPTAELQ